MKLNVKLTPAPNEEEPFGVITIDGVTLNAFVSDMGIADRIDLFNTRLKSLSYMPVKKTVKSGDVHWTETVEPIVSRFLDENQFFSFRVPGYVIHDSRLLRYIDELNGKAA